MEFKTIIRFKDLEARLSHQADDSVRELLAGTVLGSKGGMRFMLRNIPSRIAAYTSIRFVSLFKGNRLTGTVGLSYRLVKGGGKEFHSLYLRYLSFLPVFQNAIDARGKGDRRKREKESESMKSQILSFFRKPYMLDLPGFEKDDTSVIYAYVESMNERSKNLVHQIGFEYIRSFLTVAFSRFNPVADQAVSKLRSDEKEQMKKLLSQFYSEYSFYTDEYTFWDDNYFVIREGNEIVAGISAVPAAYKIVHMPGVWGWVFMNILPMMPYFRKLFVPGEFRFLVFSSIYYREGHEHSLEKLMESVCALQGFNTALTWADDRSNLFEMFRGGIDMGALNRMLNAKPGLVYANFLNMEETDKDIFYDRPAFISGFDFT